MHGFTNSFIAFCLGETMEMVRIIQDSESETSGTPKDYDHWWEVWALEQNCPDGKRVAYLPFDTYGAHVLGYVW